MAKNKNNKLIIKSDIEFKIEEEVKDIMVVEIKKIVDEMSAKFMRNIKVEFTVDVE